MTNEQLRGKLIMALDDMKAKAIEMGIQGVAAASVLNKGETVDWIGEMKVVGSPYNQKGGLNLVAIAWTRIDWETPFFIRIFENTWINVH